MAITPIKITNRVGTTVSSPSATTNVGPTTGDLDPDNHGSLLRIFDVELTSGGSGEFLQITIPDSIKIHAPGTGGAGLGLDISLLPLNAAAGPVHYHVAQGASLITVTFLAAMSDGIFRVKIDGRHSVGR